MKAQRIYWCLHYRTARHQTIVNQLESRNVHVQIAEDIVTLKSMFQKRRTASVVIEYTGDQESFIADIKNLMYQPLFFGVRFVLSYRGSNSELIRFLAKMGFRDALSTEITPKRWVDRFLYAVASGPLRLRMPQPQMTLEQIAAVALPCRITYIDSRFLRLEARLKVEPGGKIRLSGRLAHELGVPSLSLKVAKRSESNLHFRFSDSYLMEWSVPNSQLQKIELLFNNLKQQAIEDPIRVFAAIHTPETRQLLTDQLPYPAFELALALQKKSLIYEPRFFSPDIFFIEAKLLKLYGTDAFSETLERLSVETQIYILGTQIEAEDLHEFIQNAPQEVYFVNRIPEQLPSHLQSRFKKHSRDQQHQHGFHLPKSHRFSYAELRVPARLTKLHAETAQIVSPFRLGDFGMITIESPVFKRVLGRGLTAKITHSFSHEDSHLASFPESADCVFSDTTQEERQKLASHLVELFQRSLLAEPETELKAEPERRLTSTKPVPPTEARPAPEPSASPASSFQQLRDRQDELSLPDIGIPEVGQPSSSPYRSYHESFWVKYRKEVNIVLAVIIMFGLLFLSIYALRQPESEQGKIFTDSILRYYEAVNPGRALPESQQAGEEEE